jgi:two-component system, NarL family, nitrate/nitrite response regulator NarL
MVQTISAGLPIRCANGEGAITQRRVWTVAVADGQPLFREALAQALAARPELEVVGQAADGRQALRLLRSRRPAVAILDVELAGVDGPAVFEALAGEGAGIRVVFLSATLDGALVHRLLSDGAAGYLTKGAGRDEICEAVVAVAEGGTVLSTDAQTRLAEQLRSRAAAPPVELSDRERAVLGLIAEGLSAPAIGRRMHLSESTVRTHAQHLYEKLGVSERAAAVAQAMRRGLIE